MDEGFCNVQGDYIAVMDADLQDPPSLLPEMIRFSKLVNMIVWQPEEKAGKEKQRFVVSLQENSIRLLIKYQMPIL